MATSIPFFDATDRIERITVDGAQEHLGNPHSTLMSDGRTILAVYGRGHGGKGPLLATSDDGGKNWKIRKELSNDQVTKDHSVFSLDHPDGGERLVLFGVDPGTGTLCRWSCEDGGEWTCDDVKGIGGCAVAPRSVVRVKEGRHLMLYHTVEQIDSDWRRTKIWQACSTDGGTTWRKKPEPIWESAEEGFCEPCLIKSGDTVIALLRAYNDGQKAAWIKMTKDNWSPPRPLPDPLNGDAHVAFCSKDDSKLVVCFRQSRDQARQRHQRCQYFVAWTGTFDDVVEGRQGDGVAILLKNDGFEPKDCGSRRGKFRFGDCGYAGLSVLGDGTFVAVVHSTLNEEGDECPSIYCLRFKLSDIRPQNVNVS